MTRPLGMPGIARLGLVQAALGALVVLATSTLNRVMVVEWAMPAIIPGALVAMHYLVQVLRPRMGYGSDIGRRRTPWIIGGMAALACGAVGAAAATAWMGTNLVAGVAAAVLAFGLIGAGVGACGTSLLVLLAALVAPQRRSAAAGTAWIMMIAGIAITATVAGRMLQPFSPGRLLAVTAVVSAAAFLLTVAAVWRIEPRASRLQAQAASPPPFLQALRQVWADDRARCFAIFVFLSMLAYSAQELVLEPFAGAVFHLNPGESTGFVGLQHGGVLLGMLLVAVAGGRGRSAGSMRMWTIGGCAGSGAAILALGACGLTADPAALRPVVFVLGMANGTFAVSAIGAMMALAGQGASGQAGTRMGVWGAAQAVAFALGGLLSTVASDAARAVLGDPALAYATVFAAEGVLFLLAARQAARVFHAGPASARLVSAAAGELR